MTTVLTDQERQQLIQIANEARKNAYVPYSRYRVGAALRSKSGRIFTGVNVENAAYTVGICGERTAIFKAVSEGEREFDAIAVVTDNGGSPCGACRQILYEYARDAALILVTTDGQIERAALRDLLPDGFDASDLEP